MSVQASAQARIRPGKASGFTLIETMVALMIAATAAALILTQLRGMIARVDQERQHELDALRVLNQSAWFAIGSPGDEKLVPVDETSMRIQYRDPERPAVTVRNFSAPSNDVPPIVLAYTPFQQYSISAGNYSLSLIAPGIERPDAIKRSRASATAKESTATQQGGDKTAENSNRGVSITPRQP